MSSQPYRFLPQIPYFKPGIASPAPVMSSQRFCLRWNNHQSNLLSVFDQLLHDESFVDVTLAVEGQLLKAHKMVLSACSPYFQALFMNHPDKHPIVILKDVPYNDMKCLLDFMYRGEVSVDQDRLTAFLRVAESLKIKGLTEVNEEKCDSIASSLTQQNLHNLPNLQRLQQTKRFGNSLNMLSNALLQPKRKRGRPRKLSGCSNGPDDYDKDIVQGSPEMLEVKMGMDNFTGNNSDASVKNEAEADDDKVKDETDPVPGSSNDQTTKYNHQDHEDFHPSGVCASDTISKVRNLLHNAQPQAHVVDLMLLYSKWSYIVINMNLMSKLQGTCHTSVKETTTSISTNSNAYINSTVQDISYQDSLHSDDLEIEEDTENDIQTSCENADETSDKAVAIDNCTSSSGTPKKHRNKGIIDLDDFAQYQIVLDDPTNYNKNYLFNSAKKSKDHEKSARDFCVREKDNLYRCTVCDRNYTHIKLLSQKLLIPKTELADNAESSNSEQSNQRPATPASSRISTPDNIINNNNIMTPSTSAVTPIPNMSNLPQNFPNAMSAPSTGRQPTKRRVRRRATSQSQDPAEALTEMSVRGLNLFRYASINEGVYQCTECAKVDVQKTFKNKYSFQRHAFLYHEGHQRKVFPCPVCQKEFSRPDKMKNHMKTVHDCFMPKDVVFPPMGFFPAL
ncbi:unnamed protein product [Diabrotica balteata]|uniref:Uncharacterized protein n=1 Tax=Diabrotica balteata TaxID=107213 RepID=A0A9N9X969_DIABA|nr:unnamed protein product [Diabrotica balteata]